MGLFSFIGIILISFGIFALPVTWNFLLVFTGFEFSIIGWILGVFLDRVPGAMINDLKKDKSLEKEVFPYHLTQLYYYFLYTMTGISLTNAGLVIGISRLPD